MKYQLNILIFISLVAFDTPAQELPGHIRYVANPNTDDSLCIAEIARAKKDLENGKIVFTQGAGLLFGELRYEKELRELCNTNGLEFDVDLFSCIEMDGQTQGCYGAYMDKVIIDQYGLNFKEKLHQQADSLFLHHTLKNNNIVQYWDCDERPRLPTPTENKRVDDDIPAIAIAKPVIKRDEGRFDGWPFFDLGFIVETDSSVSGFYIRNFVPQHEENKKYEHELFEIAVTYLKLKYPVWVPGKINGVPVRTDNNVRIYLTKME